MSPESRLWTVRVSAAAENDYREILVWMQARFGSAQAHEYAETLAAALEALADNPAAEGVNARNDLAKGLYALHVARHGRKGRHFVLFRFSRGRRVIEVLRLLHDAMDLPRHFRSRK